MKCYWLITKSNWNLNRQTWNLNRHFLLATGGDDNYDANFNNINFTIWETKFYGPVVTLSTKDQKLSKLFCRGFEISVYWNEYKTKSKMKNTINKSKYQDDNTKRY